MRVVALILAGGAGTRLGVLSENRAKPAVPFAGRFRIIDFTLSNCVNSGHLRRRHPHAVPARGRSTSTSASAGPGTSTGRAGACA